MTDQKAQTNLSAKPFNQAPLTINLFVYGTLMPGFGNYRLIANNRGVYKATLKGAELYHPGAGFPAIVLTADQSKVVKGYLVSLAYDSPALGRVDNLEGFRGFSNPNNHYQKSMVGVEVLPAGSDPESAVAWVYNYSSEKLARYTKAERIESGSWEEYTSRDEEGQTQELDSYYYYDLDSMTDEDDDYEGNDDSYDFGDYHGTDDDAKEAV